ncbi:M48 family metallopeptidase [Coralloluteibacterium thermophilus]|uniref:M48 family metallopeptidase n=1 Tax=Coralloluteibacterium thermophilum TaxID=2707049 RepID=A0ABV9NQL4_9GAMM
MKHALFAAALAAALVACATSPTGRTQLRLFSGSEMNQMGIAAFDEMKAKDPLANNPQQSRYVQCVVEALVRVLPPDWQQLPWEAQVFQNEQANAFALPGGKVGVNTGMFQVARNQDQLAAVIGHEIGHVVAQHSNERVSHTALAQTGMTAVQAYAGTRGATPQNTQALMSALGAGVQVGYLLPFSRVQETEADVVGQQLMARAGFDPAAAAALWENMIAASGRAGVPQLLSTHPDPQNRIRELAARAPSLAADYQQARQEGRTPRCG